MKKRKVEASKKIVIFCDILLSAVTITTFVAAFLNVDVSSLVTLDICIAGLVTTAHGFYFDKARRENVLRLGEAYKLKIEQLKQLAQSSEYDNGLEMIDIYSQEG